MPLVRVHYDFASSLCYVAHRRMQQMAPVLAELGIELAWTPVDLCLLTGWPRGGDVPEERRRNAERVARELSVPVSVPRRWLDSRRANASAILVEQITPPERGVAWRERVFSAVFEEQRDVTGAALLCALARELDLRLEAAAIEARLPQLERRTRAAAEQEVTGVPTFMLDAWPFAGIQSDATMRSIFERWARRRESKAPAG